MEKANDNDKETQLWEDIWSFYEKYGDYLHSLNLRYEHLDSSDLVHDFFVQKMPNIIEKVKRIANEKDIKFYILASFRNFSIDRYRKIKRQEKGLEDFLFCGDGVHYDFSEERETIKNFMQDFYQAKEHLSKNTREILTLIFDGFSMRDMAKIYKISRYKANLLMLDSLLALLVKMRDYNLLSHQEIRVIELLCVEGSSESEISLITGYNKGQVKNIIHRARDIAQEILKRIRHE